MATKSTKSTKSRSKSKTLTANPQTSKSNKPKPTNSSDFISIKKQYIYIFIAILAVLMGAAWTKYRYFFIVATVNKQPISSWQYVSQLNQTSGSQTLQQQVVETLISQDANHKNITASQEEINEQIETISQQFETVGGIDSLLASQNLTRSAFENQIKLNILAQKLAGEADVTTEEIDEYFKNNQEQFSDQTQAEVQEQIKSVLEQQKGSDNFQILLQQLLQDANIQIFLPDINLSQLQTQPS